MKKLIMDNREPPILLSLLSEKFEVEIKKLPTFDYIIGGKVGVERKTFPDLVGSVVDKRIYEQARRMVESSYNPLILVEGSISSSYSIHRYIPNFKQDARKTAMGVLVDLALNFSIPIVFSENHEDTVYVLEKISRSLNSFKHHTPRINVSLSPTVRLLSLIPGIGPTTAHKIVKRCGKKITYYTYKKLLSVNGVGKKSAGRIMKFIGELV